MNHHCLIAFSTFQDEVFPWMQKIRGVHRFQFFLALFFVEHRAFYRIKVPDLAVSVDGLCVKPHVVDHHEAMLTFFGPRFDRNRSLRAAGSLRNHERRETESKQYGSCVPHTLHKPEWPWKGQSKQRRHEANCRL